MLEYPAWLFRTPEIPSGGTTREHSLKDEPATPAQLAGRLSPNHQGVSQQTIDRMRAMEAAGVSRAEICRTLRAHSDTIRKYLGRKAKWLRHKKPVDNRWGELIVDILKHSGLTRHKVSIVIGCTHPMVARWMAGATPTKKYQVKLLSLHADVCPPSSTP